MPPPPEVGDALREVGTLEVLVEPDAEHLRTPARDVHVAREVGVELDGVEDEDRRPADEAGIVPDRAPHGIDAVRDDVGDHHLLEEAPRHALDAEDRLLVVEGLRLEELRREASVVADRPLQDLREVRDEERVLEEVPLGGHDLALHVDAVAEALEHVEGKTDRQQQLDRRQRGMHPDRAHQPVDVGEEELQILEHDEHPDRHDGGPHASPFARNTFCVHADSRKIGDDRRHPQENQVIRRRPGIEEPARGEKQAPAGARRQRPVGDEHGCKEDDELWRREYHEQIIMPKAR